MPHPWLRAVDDEKRSVTAEWANATVELSRAIANEPNLASPRT